METTAQRTPIDPRFKDMLAILHAGGNYGYWWNRNPKNNKNASEWWHVAEPTNPTNGIVDAYYGVHPVATIPTTNRQGDVVAPSSARSRAEHVTAVNALFGDYDAKEYASKADALAVVEALDPPPSVVIDSGNGFHCYWLLAATFKIDSDKKRAFIASVQARWVTFIGSDPQSKDLARVLRVPGTHNLKYDDKPVVSFVWCNLDQRYSLTDLVALLPDDAPVAHPQRATAPVVVNDDRRKQAYIERAFDAEIANVAKAVDGNKHKELYEASAAIGNLIPHGLNQQVAFDALYNAISGRAKDKSNAADTIMDGLRDGANTPRKLPNFEPEQPNFNADGMPLCANCNSVMFKAKNSDVWGCKACLDAKVEYPFWWNGNGYTPRAVAAVRSDVDSTTGEIHEPKPRKRKLIHGDEMAGLFPPTEWIIPNVIPKGKLIENFGMGGSGKSLINLDIALTVANFANVIYIAAEDETEYLERKEAWHAFHKKPAPGFYFWGEPVNLMQPDEVEAFLNEACAVDPVLIVLDPLASCMAGYNDSETGAMSVAIDSLNRMRKATGATVLICHHTGWSDTHERGSSALRWACRMVMKTTNHDEYVSLSCEKVNGMKKFDKRYFKMVETDTAPVMVPFDKITERGTKVTGKQIEVLETLRKSIFRDGATFTQIFDDLQQAKSTLNDSISRLIDLGAIVKQGSGRSGVTYLITERGTSILDRHDMGKNPSFTHAPVDNTRGFNWLVQCGTEQNTEQRPNKTPNNDRTNTEQGSAYYELDGYDSSVDIPHSDAVVHSSSVPSSVVVHSTRSSSFSPPSLEGADDEQRTEQTSTPQQQPSWDKLDWPYVTRQYAAGNTAAIKTHCSMRRISFDDVMAELQGIVLPDDFENEIN